MNFLEAHIIYWEYVDIFASGKNKVWGSERMLPFYCNEWKDILIAAYQIVLSHAILWDLGDNEFFDSSFRMLKHFDIMFIEDGLSTKILTAFCVVEQKRKLYKLFHKKDIEQANILLKKNLPEMSSSTYRYDDVVNVFNAMLHYKAEVIIPRLKLGENMSVLVNEYARKTYELSGLEYRPEYQRYFVTLDDMRKEIGCGQFFYAYREEIMSSRI